MKKTILAVLLALPLAAVAQRGPGPGAGQGPGAGPGGPAADPKVRAERMEKRMQLARTLGLAEALDLDATQALKLRDQLAKFDDRRLAAHKQLADSHDVLRRAAQGEKATAAEVDQAIARAFEARTQIDQIDRETVQSLGKDLTPEKRARAVLFLQRFHQRMGRGGPGGMGPGMGMGPGAGMMGPGAGRRGMGPGMMHGGQGGPGGCQGCAMNGGGDDGGGDGEDE